jgi:hypothetical protein
LLAPGPHHGPVAPDSPEATAQRRDPVARQAPVGLDLRLARAAGADPAVDPACAQPLEVGPQPPHAGEVVLELGELDLELALGRVGVVGKDVEDHRSPVDHRHPQCRLQVALLARGKLVVAGHQVGVTGGDRLFQLAQLAGAEVAIGVGLRPLLDHVAGRGDTGGAKQLLELRQGIVLADAVDYADRKRPLAGPRVGHPGVNGAGVRLGRAAVSRSFH